MESASSQQEEQRSGPPQLKDGLSPADALKIITPYFPQEWNLTEDQITVSKISGGYMNTVYKVQRSTESMKEPKNLVIRGKGGGTITVKQNDESSGLLVNEVEEALVSQEASKFGVGPKLYGVFVGGRIEEYVENHTLRPEEQYKDDILCDTARCYARFHQIKAPLKPTIAQHVRMMLGHGISAFENNISHILDSFINGLYRDAPETIDWDYLKKFPYSAEYRWAMDVFNKVGFRNVTTAGDPNYLNVLVREGEIAPGNSKVVLVDYELATIQPRGVELGGHFANRALKWNDPIDKKSGFSVVEEQQRQAFIDEYAKEIYRLNAYDDLDKQHLDSKEHIMEEAEIGMLVYLLTFSIFVVMKLEFFSGDKSFPTGSIAMLKAYQQAKPTLIDKYPHWK